MSSFIGNKPFQVPTNSDLGRLAFLDYTGMEDFGSSVPTITTITSSTISINSKVTYIDVASGVISIINVPGEFVNGGQITLIPKQVFTTNTLGNIAVIVTAEVSKPLTFIYESAVGKWYPSYVNTSAYTNVHKLSNFQATTSAELASVISDETGYTTNAKLMFSISPTISNSLITGSTSFDLINTNATTLNIGSAATIVKLGSVSSGTTTIGYNLSCGNDISAAGNITAYSTSDQRLKENITPIEDPISKLLKLSGNTFKWSSEYYSTQDQKLFKEFDVGVIAQEVQQVLPEAVHERDNGMLAVDYQKLVPLLIECIKAQQIQIDELKGSK